MSTGRSSRPRRRAAAAVPVERSSGNVFHDLGLPGSGQLLIKSEIVGRIAQILEQRSLTQAVAAELLGVSQADVSDIVRGKLAGYSIERLLRFLNALGQDVRLVFPSRLRRGRPGRVQIHTDGSSATPARTRRK